MEKGLKAEYFTGTIIFFPEFVNSDNLLISGNQTQNGIRFASEATLPHRRSESHEFAFYPPEMAINLACCCIRFVPNNISATHIA